MRSMVEGAAATPPPPPPSAVPLPRRCATGEERHARRRPILPMTDPVPLLRLVAVSKHFAGVTALDQVDWEVMPGEVHCLVGENGCGKSTLIKIVSGVHQP